MKTTKEFNIALGEQVRLYRERKAMRQRDLAWKVGISPQQISKYESGEDAITTKRLTEICALIQCHYATLIARAL